MILAENKKFTPLSAFLAAITVLFAAASYVQLPLYFDMCDEPYQIMCGWDYRTSVVAPLSAWFTSAVGAWVDFDMLPLRQIGWTLTLASVLAGTVPVWWITRNLDFTLLCAAVAVGLAGACRLLEWLYGWDCLAAFPTMMVALAAFRFAIKPGYKPLLWGAVWLGIATMMRLPSVAIGVAPIAAVLAAGERGKKLACSALFLGVAAATALAIILVLYGSVGTYLGFFADGVINEHSPLHMAEEYKLHLIDMPFYFLLFAGAFFAACRLLEVNNRAWQALAIICVAATLAVCTDIWMYEASRGLAPVNIAIVAALLWCIWRCRGKAQRQWRLFGILALITLLSAAAGSNMMIYKCLTYEVLPVALLLVVVVSQGWREIAAWGIILASTAWVAAERNLGSANANGTVLSCPFPTETTIEGMGHHDGLELDRNWTGLIQDMVDEFSPYVRSDEYRTVVVRNMPRHFIFEYMFDARNPVLPHYWSMDNLMDHDDYCRAIEHHVDTIEPPVAVLLLQNISSRFDSEPGLITRMKERYRTVYSDTSFTIVIKDANQGKQ